MKRRTQNFMAIDNAVQRLSERSYIQSSVDPDPALRTVSAALLRQIPKLSLLRGEAKASQLYLHLLRPV
jgi:hypothetical protein